MSKIEERYKSEGFKISNVQSSEFNLVLVTRSNPAIPSMDHIWHACAKCGEPYSTNDSREMYHWCKNSIDGHASSYVRNLVSVKATLISFTARRPEGRINQTVLTIGNTDYTVTEAGGGLNDGAFCITVYKCDDTHMPIWSFYTDTPYKVRRNQIRTSEETQVSAMRTAWIGAEMVRLPADQCIDLPSEATRRFPMP